MGKSMNDIQQFVLYLKLAYLKSVLFDPNFSVCSK